MYQINENIDVQAEKKDKRRKEDTVKEENSKEVKRDNVNK